MKVVKKAIKVRIYPTNADINDNGEKKANIGKIESNFGIYRFIYDETLIFINNFKNLLLQYGYNVEKIIVNHSSCNLFLKMLRHDFKFLEKAESSSRQQAQKDLINAFNRYYNPNLNSEYPILKTRKNTKKFSFRIINNNNVRITKDKNGFDKIKLAKLGIVKFKTSKKYHEILRRGSDTNDESVKIKHVTVKKENNIYYAIFNIEKIHIPETIIGPKQQVGIDIGCSELAVISNGQEIPNLDLTRETDQIIKYQKTMNNHQPGSIRYQEAQRLLNKWWKKLLNKRNDYYNKIVHYIVKKQLICRRSK